MNLKQLRDGMNQRDMASKLGIKQSYYSLLENGKVPMTANIARKLVNEFGISFNEAFSDG